MLVKKQWQKVTVLAAFVAALLLGTFMIAPAAHAKGGDAIRITLNGSAQYANAKGQPQLGFGANCSRNSRGVGHPDQDANRDADCIRQLLVLNDKLTEITPPSLQGGVFVFRVERREAKS